MLRIIMGGKKKTINLTTDLGLQMLNGIPEDIDHEEFIEHARIEWIDQGYEIDDFNLDNFTDYVVRRDVKSKKIKNRLDDLRGISRFEEKEYKMQRIIDRRITPGKLAKWSAQAGVAVGTEMYYAGVEVGKVLEPGFSRRARRRRQNLAQIAITEAQEEQLTRTRIGKQVERREWELLEEERSLARQQRIAEMAPSAQIMSDLSNATEDERKRREHEHFNERRKAQVQQFAADIEQAKMQAEKDKEAKMKKLREWRASHWSAKADELAVESMDRLSQRIEARETLNNDFVAADRAEAAQREIDRGQEQVFGPAVSSDTQYVDGESLGIFGTPMEPGEFMSAAGGDEPGVDDKTVDLFSATAQTSYEEDVNDMHFQEAEVRRKEELYSALTEESKEMSIEMDNLVILRGRLEAELQQTGEEHHLLGVTLAGPPRIDATSKQVSEVHLRKNRATELKRQMNEIDHRSELLRTRKGDLDSQGLDLAKEVAGLREKLSAEKSRIDSTNEGLGELPMIVGKNISKVEGGPGEFMGKPNETYSKVTHAMRLELIKASAENTLATHREARQMDHRIWVMNEQRQNSKLHFESLLTKLAGAADRVKIERSKAMRDELIQALEMFFKSDHKLRVVHVHHHGPLNWWRFRAGPLVKNIRRWKSNETTDWKEKEPEQKAVAIAAEQAKDEGVEPMDEKNVADGAHENKAAGSGGVGEGPGEEQDDTEADSDEEDEGQGFALSDRIGVMMGEIPLPKFEIFDIELVITKTFPYELSQGDPTDRVTIKIGPSLRNLTQIATVHNVPNEEDGQFRHTIKHTLRADKIAYSFEFTSVDSDFSKAMVVERGTYEHKELAPLEYNKDTNRCLSSYVKLLRIDAVTGKGVWSKWLAELITAEEASTLHWDSASMLGYNQRYVRTDFVKLMKEHLIRIKKQEEKDNEHLAKAQEGAHEKHNKLDEKEERHLKRVQESLDAFIQRKRDKQQGMVDEAMKLVGQKIEVFNKREQKWEHGSITDCRVKWRDNGIRAEIRHKLQRFDDLDIKIGKAKWENLKNLRYYPAKKSAVDVEAMERWKKNEAMRKKVQDEQRAKEEQRKAALLARRQERAAGTNKFNEDREKAMKKRAKESGAEARKLVRKARGEIAEARKRLIEEYKVGIGTPSGQPEILSLREANRMAKATWIDNYCKAEIAKEEAKWDARQLQRDEQQALEDEEEREEEERIAALELKERAIRNEMLAKMRLEKRAELRKRITISKHKFNHATPLAPFCEHLRCKAWGDCYGKGVRCVTCGKEITMTHEEEGQLAGLGSGDDPVMVDNIERHRKNEAGYRFRNSEELTAVGKMRRKLEKERWDQTHHDPYFYDFEDIRQIYEFDRRHQYHFRDEGVTRQGVQWTEEAFKERYEKMKASVDNLSPTSKKKSHAELDRWLAGARPPTFRREDISHQAQFRDTILTFARINNYRSRLWDLKQERVEQLTDSNLQVLVLAHLHQQIVRLEMHLKHVERDMQSTAQVLLIKRLAEVQYADAAEIRMLAQQDLREKEMITVGKVEDAEESEQAARELGEQVRGLLRQRVYVERKMEGVMERQRNQREKADSLLQGVKDMQNKVESMHYRQRGVVVPTPYGHCQVLLYREADDMVVVKLPKNKQMQMRMYLPLAVCMQIEREISESTRVAMEAEEEASRVYYKAENELRALETQRMGDEERTQRDQIKFAREIEEEEAMVDLTVTQAVRDAKKFLERQEGKNEITDRVMKALAKHEKTVDHKIRTWRGEGKRPKKFKSHDRLWYRISQRSVQRRLFLEEQASLSETEARNAIEQKHRNRAEEATFEFIIFGFLHEYITSVASEALKAGLEAKRRAEEETGIVFPDPPHMQYEVYHVLSNWWMSKKKELQKNLEQWGARSAQDELRWEAEKANRNKLMRDVELREKLETEKRRQEELCREMMKEEAYCRRFYKEEMKQCLDERRQMRTAEIEKRLFDKQLKLFEEMQASKYQIAGATGFDEEEAVPGGMTAKEHRRLQLKKNRADKQRQRREIEKMMEEDELSGQVRAELRKIEQQAALKKEMELYGMGEGDEEIEEDDRSIHSDFSSEDESEDEEEAAELARIVEAEDLDADQARELRRKMRKKKRLEKLRARANAKREAAERAAANELERAKMATLIEHAKVELEWMEVEEEAKLVERELRVNSENVRKVTLYCQMKGQEEMRAKALSRKLRGTADKDLKAVEDALEFFEKCSAELDRCKRVKFRVDIDTEFTDTSAICGFLQRYESPVLFQKLRHLYFWTLAGIVANRAELIATERRLMRINEELVSNEEETKTKTKDLAQLWKEQKRSDLMRMRRSELGTKMFTKWQNSILTKVFEGWVRFWMWHQGMRNAFNLKYALIKQELDLKRLHPETRDAKERKQNTMATGDDKRDANSKKTLLQQHQSKPIQCRLCGIFYLEGHNTDRSCRYHPGEYKTACPSWCPGLSTNCMSHRTRRWTCCDVREKGKFGNTGCQSRFHMPPEKDPDYKAAVDLKDEFFVNEFTKLGREGEEVKTANWALQAKKIKIQQLDDIKDHVEEERKVVRRFHNPLDLDEKILINYEVDPFTGEARLKDPADQVAVPMT